MTHDVRNRICQLLEPWAVLATGAFITSCASRNFSAIDLLKTPVQIQGKIDGRTARISVPKWFPVDESHFQSQAGLIYSRVKDLAVAHRAQAAGEVVQVGFDLSGINLRPDVQSFTLTYFPWFRFMTEPICFDAAGQVAHYIARCVHFLLRSKGFAATLRAEGDACAVTTDTGIRIEASGMAALRQLCIAQDASTSVFDLANRRIELAAGMFPAAYAAGSAMLQTPDRLLNIAAEVEADRFVLAYREESVHVQA